jgi:hypothetical protein
VKKKSCRNTELSGCPLNCAKGSEDWLEWETAQELKYFFSDLFVVPER